MHLLDRVGAASRHPRQGVAFAVAVARPKAAQGRRRRSLLKRTLVVLRWHPVEDSTRDTAELMGPVEQSPTSVIARHGPENCHDERYTASALRIRRP